VKNVFRCHANGQPPGIDDFQTIRMEVQEDVSPLGVGAVMGIRFIQNSLHAKGPAEMTGPCIVLITN
jgi:hypothetical protein